MLLVDWMQTVVKCKVHNDHKCYIKKNSCKHGSCHYRLYVKSRCLPTAQLQKQKKRQEQAAQLKIALPVVASGVDWYVVPHMLKYIPVNTYISSLAPVSRVNILSRLRPKIKRLQHMVERLGLCDQVLSTSSIVLNPMSGKLYITDMSQCAKFSKQVEKLRKMQNTIMSVNNW